MDNGLPKIFFFFVLQLIALPKNSKEKHDIAQKLI